MVKFTLSLLVPPLLAVYALVLLIALDMDRAYAQYALVLPVAYVLGSIPWGFFITHVAVGVDIRQVGSGKIGTSNVLRTAGGPLALLALGLDLSKGLLAVLLARIVVDTVTAEVAAALLALAGHNWSLFLGFRGGRGIATGLGGLLLMAPIAGGIALASFAPVTLFTRLLSLGSITAVVVAFLSILGMALLGHTPSTYLVYAGYRRCYHNLAAPGQYPAPLPGHGAQAWAASRKAWRGGQSRFGPAFVLDQDWNLGFCRRVAPGSAFTTGLRLDKVAVIGTTTWGTTLAILLARKDTSVTLLARTPEESWELEHRRQNSRFLPGVDFPGPSLSVSHDPKEALADVAMVVLAVPSGSFRDNVKRVQAAIGGEPLVLSVSKGLEMDTGKRMSQVLEEELPAHLRPGICVLSGPNLALEIAQGKPASTVVASRDNNAAGVAQGVLMSPSFRVYTNEDIVGVELGGALKNIIALGAGMCDGLGYGDNGKAAFITRGLAEITRLGVAAGANPLTFAGLAGLGDLAATCASPLSRNRSVGEQLAAGKPLTEVLASMKNVAEGVYTTAAALKMAQELDVEMAYRSGYLPGALRGHEPPPGGSRAHGAASTVRVGRHRLGHALDIGALAPEFACLVQHRRYRCDGCRFGPQDPSPQAHRDHTAGAGVGYLFLLEAAFRANKHIHSW